MTHWTQSSALGRLLSCGLRKLGRCSAPDSRGRSHLGLSTGAQQPRAGRECSGPMDQLLFPFLSLKEQFKKQKSEAYNGNSGPKDPRGHGIQYKGMKEESKTFLKSF